MLSQNSEIRHPKNGTCHASHNRMMIRHAKIIKEVLSSIVGLAAHIPINNLIHEYYIKRRAIF